MEKSVARDKSIWGAAKIKHCRLKRKKKASMFY